MAARLLQRLTLFSLTSLTRLVSATLYGPPQICPATYEWEGLPSIPTTRQEGSVARLGNKVYVIGGTTTNGSDTTVASSKAFGIRTVRDVLVYDTAQRTWSTIAPMPISVNHGNAATVNGKVYVLGGLSGAKLTTWNAIPDSYVYDPLTDSWKDLTPMPVGTARGGAAVGVHGPMIFLAGGITQLELKPNGIQSSVSHVSAYNTETGEWHTGYPPIPGPRDHVGGAMVGSTFYVTGGRDNGQYNTRNNTWALNIHKPAAWLDMAPMPTARGGLATAAVGEYIFTFGGEGDPNTASGVFDDTQIYDSVNNSWLIGPRMSVPRHGTNAVAIGADIYIAGGGVQLSTSPTDAMTVFRPKIDG